MRDIIDSYLNDIDTYDQQWESQHWQFLFDMVIDANHNRADAYLVVLVNLGTIQLSAEYIPY